MTYHKRISEELSKLLQEKSGTKEVTEMLELVKNPPSIVVFPPKRKSTGSSPSWVDTSPFDQEINSSHTGGLHDSIREYLSERHEDFGHFLV